MEGDDYTYLATALRQHFHVRLNMTFPFFVLLSLVFIPSYCLDGITMTLRPRNGSNLHLAPPEQASLEQWWEGGSSTGIHSYLFVVATCSDIFLHPLHHQNCLFFNIQRNLRVLGTIHVLTGSWFLTQRQPENA